jgi:3-oxoacyl-[acyl-carrier-protein] synthase-3
MSVALGPIRGVRIAGAGVAQPLDTAHPSAVELDNAGVYAALLGERWRDALAQRRWSVEHPASAWGVERRQWVCIPGRGDARERATIVDLARVAAQRALHEVGRAPQELDLLVAATSIPTGISSSFASTLARALGVACACLDIRGGGAGGLQALAVGAQSSSAGAGRVLVVAAETCSPWLDPRDLASSLLFADSAAALVLERAPDEPCGLERALLGSAFAAGRPFTIPGPLPPDAAAARADEYRLQTPDEDYARAMHAAWLQTAREMRGVLASSGVQSPACLPGAVTRAQIEGVGGELDLDVALALAGLRQRGALGSAASLALIADARRTRGDSPFAALAVGGGVNWAAILWRP